MCVSGWDRYEALTGIAVAAQHKLDLHRALAAQAATWVDLKPCQPLIGRVVEWLEGQCLAMVPQLQLVLAHPAVALEEEQRQTGQPGQQGQARRQQGQGQQLLKQLPSQGLEHLQST